MAGCSCGDVGGCSLKRERLITDSSFELTLKLNKLSFPCCLPSHYPPQHPLQHPNQPPQLCSTKYLHLHPLSIERRASPHREHHREHRFVAMDAAAPLLTSSSSVVDNFASSTTVKNAYKFEVKCPLPLTRRNRKNLNLPTQLTPINRSRLVSIEIHQVNISCVNNLVFFLDFQVFFVNEPVFLNSKRDIKLLHSRTADRPALQPH